ncbi:hypothetical protein KQI85_09255 [Falcatimonas sp. MSJ-15]|uniref:hypothetical protein n=1 Tax=Falcatimonas sp. MSJ-15 TaxID=2841515 RepID=UPI001C0FD843|nr:hypothetical protein [Falcatimonas sp. MSJ-15]MBU5470561.1 hypothetical protein [Falcatimonas sp. MSJ-15]
MQKPQIINIMDGEIADSQLVREFEISELCRDGRYAFVGFINKKNRMLISVPKHFNYTDDSDIKLIIRCILKSFRDTDKGSTQMIDCNIPYRAYTLICDYYNRYGLFKNNVRVSKSGYSGNIDWNRTVRKSQKIISGKNLIFLPFEIRKNEQYNTFLGECMKYTINDGYEQFGRYAGIGEKIDSDGYHFNFKNTQAVIKKLKEEEEKYFKDSEIQLIRAMISYFRWQGSITESSYFLTQAFALSWEAMVQNYLNNNLLRYDNYSKNMIFERGCKKFNFHKRRDSTESVINQKKNHDFTVEYDHFFEQQEEGKVWIFDSKYYQRMSELNYKQVAYSYFLMNDIYGKRVLPEKIINGLVMPYEGEYYSRVHIDRRDIDGIYIQEHYLNIRDVMRSYI